MRLRFLPAWRPWQGKERPRPGDGMERLNPHLLRDIGLVRDARIAPRRFLLRL